MIKKLFSLFSFILILLIVVYLGSKLANHPGYVLFSYKNWSIEISLWFALLSILFLLFIFYSGLRLSNSMRRFVQNFYIWKLNNKIQKNKHSADLMQQGFLNLLKEDWQCLKKALPEIRKTKTFNFEEFQQLENKIHKALFLEALQADNFNKAISLWKSLPKTLKSKPDFLIAYCDYLIRKKQLKKANYLLKRAIKQDADNAELLLCLKRLIENY